MNCCQCQNGVIEILLLTRCPVKPEMFLYFPLFENTTSCNMPPVNVIFFQSILVLFFFLNPSGNNSFLPHKAILLLFSYFLIIMFEMISKGFRLFYYIKYSSPYNYQNLKYHSEYYALSLHYVHNTEPNMEMLVLCQGIVSLSSNCSAGLYVGKKWTKKTVKLMILNF